MSTNNHSNNHPRKPVFSIEELSLLDSLEMTDDDQGENTEQEQNILASIDEMLDYYDIEPDSMDKATIAKNQAIENQAIENQAIENQAIENQAIENQAIENQAIENETIENEDITEDTNWFLVASELRQQNQELMAKVSQLERALKESEINQASYHNHLVNQQAEQVSTLLEDLQAAHTTIQRQQILNETFSQQLETNQEQLAQIERECSLLQEQYNEQTYKLIETEKQAQELKYRLNREQRNALQYKAALEKSVEISAYPGKKLNNIVTVKEIPKMPPIQPWSKQIDKQDVTTVTMTNAQEVTQETPVIENIEPSQEKQVKSVESKWPSPTISLPETSQKTPPKKSVDLPTFLK